jgi:hypothetical protein
MCCAIVSLVPRRIDWYQLIICYCPLNDDLLPMKVIVGQSKYSRELLDTKIDGLIIAISTSPSCGAKLSYQLSVLVLIHTKHVKNSKFLSLGYDPIEHKITFLLHIGPINIHLCRI